jgi:glycosyltransferase involved in cell wall biosynthesis
MCSSLSRVCESACVENVEIGRHDPYVRTMGKTFGQISVGKWGCLLVAFLICVLSAPVLVATLKRDLRLDSIYFKTSKFGLEISSFDLDKNKVCSSYFQTEFAKTKGKVDRNVLFVSAEAPLETLDSIFDVGYPVYHMTSTATETLEAFLSCNSISTLVLYNFPMERIQKVSRRSLRDQKQDFPIFVMQTNGQDLAFSDNEHLMNRMLTLGNVNRFLTTSPATGAHKGNAASESYLTRVDPLIFSGTKYSGVSRSLLDSRVHVGVFDKYVPIHQLQKIIWAACTLGKQYIVHAFAVGPSAEKFTLTFQMCDNPVHWHQRMTHSATSQHSLMTQMDIHVCKNGKTNMWALAALGRGIPVITEKGLHAFSTETSKSLNRLMTYPVDASGYQIQDVIEQVLSMPRDHLAPFIRDAVRVFNARGVVKLGRVLDVDIAHVWENGLYCNRLNGHQDVSPLAKGSDMALSDSTILFIASELGGLSPGGAGVLIRALVVELLGKGAKVVVLFDTTDFGRWEAIASDFTLLANTWKKDVLKEVLQKAAAGRGSLPPNQEKDSVILLPLQEFASLDFSVFRYNEALAKSLQWAMGIEATYARHPFHMVEIFDYLGVGSALLFRRIHGRSALPLNVVVAVRIHGSFELIDTVEYVPPSLTQNRRNNMERFAMIMSDVVMYPGKEVMKMYADGLGVQVRDSVEATPPIKRMLGRFSGGSKGFDHSGRIHFVVLGKVQRIKGVFAIVNAAVQLMMAYPDARFEIHFIGMDSIDAQEKKSTILCLRKVIGEKFASRFKFLGSKTREQIFSLVAKYRAGIVGSLFETFCLSAHELHQLGLPLLMSDIPTFRNFVHGRQVLKWQHNDTMSLVSILNDAVTKDDLIKKLSMSPRMTYKNAVTPYKEIIENGPLRNRLESNRGFMTKAMCEAHQKFTNEFFDQNMQRKLMSLSSKKEEDRGLVGILPSYLLKTDPSSGDDGEEELE